MGEVGASPAPRPRRDVTSGLHTRTALSGLSWSSAYLLVSRLSAVVAVPLILTQVGDRIYTAWVLAGTLVMAQGLVDVGMTAATVRYVALAKVAGARPAVVSVLRRSAVFYLGLSAMVGGLLVAFRGDLVGLVPALDDPAAAHDARRLVVYAAIAFGITNFVAAGAAALQGLDRVAEAYRAQTIGWLVYVPVLAVMLHKGHGVDALGVAWLVAYGAQAVLVAVALPPAILGTGTSGHLQVSNRELLQLGGRWQASSWADFASLQLPRLMAGVALPGSAVVQVDLALRGAQIVVAPFFAVLPLVLPAASRDWGAGGRERLADAVSRWDQAYTRALVLVVAASLPLLVPAIAIWSDRPLGELDVALIACVLAGTAAHTWTGVMTSALLAAGEVGLIIRYKAGQLVLALVLMPIGASISLLALGVAVAVTMVLPAVDFMRRAYRGLGTQTGWLGAPVRLAIAAAAVAVPGTLVVVAGPHDASAWVVLGGVAGGILAAAGLALPLSGLRPALRQLDSQPREASA